uniref:Si:ch211-203k16.3 n=1 Tax=Cyprinus carpio TaxID=7962 RepID=A0A8C1WQ71_CYPCA
MQPHDWSIMYNNTIYYFLFLNTLYYIHDFDRFTEKLNIELSSVTGLNQQRVTNHSTVYETAKRMTSSSSHIVYWELKLLNLYTMYVFYINYVYIVVCVFTPEVQHVRNCPIDCASIYYNGVRRSGIYTVVPSLGAMPVEVYCDMDTDGGGWTVIQRRQDGSVNFDRSWKEYKEGFGDLHTEYWLGNEHIHDLTSQGDYMLRIDLEDWSGKHKHAVYQSFSVEAESTQYRLHVSGFSGTVEDSFSWYHDKQSFSTPDTGNICAEISHAGWWYNQCFYANLNGIYYKNPLGPDGIVWYTWKDSDYYSLRKVSMMIRPRTFRQHLSP